MKTRLFVAAVGIPALIYVILRAHIVVITAALALLAGIAGWELQTCVSGGENRFLALTTAVLSAFALICHSADVAALRNVLFLTLTVLFAYAIAQSGRVRFDQISAVVFSCTLTAGSFAAFIRMASAGAGRICLLLPFVLSFACDTGAYFIGKRFGKHKLSPKVSPHKTVEGSIGGMAGNLLGGLVFAFLWNRFFNGQVSYGIMAALSLVCGVTAQIGDLSFSLIKREYGIKDYGHLFLEHGGVLDRFDSVLFVAPVIELVLTLSRVL